MLAFRLPFDLRLSSGKPARLLAIGLCLLGLAPGVRADGLGIEIPGGCGGDMAGMGWTVEPVLFTAAQRRDYLPPAVRDPIPSVFATQPRPSERDAVTRAVAYFREHAPGLGVEAKAALWEELSEEIDRSLPEKKHKISYAFAWNRGNGRYLVFQGPRRFEGGRHYTLIVAPDGAVYSGLTPLIRRIDLWSADLDQMQRW